MGNRPGLASRTICLSGLSNFLLVCKLAKCNKPDGGYRIKLLGEKNDVRAYFNTNSNELESVIIIQSEIKSEISNIILATEETLNLEIGHEGSASFDLR